MSKTNIKTLLIAIISIASIAILCSIPQFKKENFDAVGLVLNIPPEWFHKKKYDPKEWLVEYSPDQISKPECINYRGPYQELNWLSSAYRLWRF